MPSAQGLENKRLSKRWVVLGTVWVDVWPIWRQRGRTSVRQLAIMAS